MRVLIYIEIKDNRATFPSLELISAAKELGGNADTILFGDELEQAAQDAERAGATAVYLVRKPGPLSEEYLVQALANLAENYDLFLFSAGRLGKSLVPQLAGKIGAGAVNDVVKLSVSDGKFVALKPAYAGRLLQSVALQTPKAVVSIRGGSYEREEAAAGSCAETNALIPEELELDVEYSQRTKILEQVVEAGSGPDLKEAKIIVSGGLGMGSKENYEKLCGGLAEVLGAALGATRAAVNKAWIGHSHQVGQTGNIVKPELYIACGLSGAVQHQAGMKESKYILAINRDEDAEIFDIANLGIVGDVNEIIPILIEEIKKKKGF
jgi:electron transfer flavoprotein alpha subunit